MVDDKERPDEQGPGSRRRPPATIDLAASEVQPPPSAEPGSSGRPAGQPADPEGMYETAVAPESPAQEPPRSRPGWPALLGAGVAGGLLVLLVAAGLWLTALRPERDEANAALAARLAGLELQVRETANAPRPAADTSDLAARISRLETALAAARPAADPALANRIGALETAAKSLSDQVAALSRRSDDVAAGVREARERAEAAAKTAGAATQSAAEQSRTAGAEQADIERLSARLAALEAASASIQDQVAKLAARPTGDRTARLAVAASALKSAVERGAPYAAELAALKPLVADAKALAPLEPFAATGVPRAAALSGELSALAPEMLRRAAPANAAGEGYLDRLQAHAERLVRIRPATGAAGDDPAAVIARMEIKAGQGDLDGALAEAAKLQSQVRAPADGWITKAKARQAAVAAAQGAAADALAALAKPAP